MYHFIKACKSQHLTIADVKNLKIGDKIDVIIWDRNFEENWIWDHAESEKPYDPQTFFKSNHHQLTYAGNMTWHIHFDFGETITHPIHLDTSDLETRYTWCALENDGFIHITDEVIKCGEKIPTEWKPKHIHWTKFPDSTRVGWRGPIMLWEKLKNKTYVYYDKKH